MVMVYLVKNTINLLPTSSVTYMFLLKCYYDEKFCSRSLSIPILYLEKNHHANYCGSISKTSLNFLTTISRLNCPPLPDSVPVELHLESWIERESDVIYLRV